MTQNDVKISVYIAISLDGFIARENGDLDWLPGSDGAMDGDDLGFADFLASVDVLVMGRQTYDFIAGFGQWGYGKTRVIILSRTLKHIADWMPDTVEIRAGDPETLVADLAAEGVKHIYVDGGQTIQQFLNAGLINELIITRIPVLIGRGIPLFGAVSKDIPLLHRETKSFPNGFVQSWYEIDA